MGITGERCDEPVLRYEHMDEQPRPDANTDEHAYTLTVEEALLRYEAAGHGRTARALQKYCARGDLDCMKEETTYGQRYRITPASVVRHLEQIEQVSQTKGREQPRPDASVRVPESLIESELQDGATVREQPRPDASQMQYLTQLEKRLDEKDGEIVFLRSEIAVKNEQIREQTGRARETNVLIAGLQKMLTPLLGRSSEPRPSERSHAIPFDISEARDADQQTTEEQ
jgi:hypothetical protein